MMKFSSNQWALILGGSTGFGLATAKKLSEHGMNVFVVHRDRRGAMERINRDFNSIRENSAQFHSLNINALTASGRNEVLETLKDLMGESGKVRVLLHSIALGNLKPIAPVKNESASDIAISKLSEKLEIDRERTKGVISDLLEEGCDSLHTLLTPNYGSALLGEEDMEQTIYNMGSSLLSYTQDVFSRDLFGEDSRVIGLTSEGNEVAWRGYAAIGAAKVALESISRSIAVEFAPYGIRSNIVQPGVTPTPALKLIPGNLQMKSGAKLRNPFGRTTTPEDVANVIALLATDEAAWINGTLIRVDGGERVASF